MPRPVAQVRLDKHATCRHVLFVEGEPVGYTDDVSGGLIGSGLSSWIGLSETAIGGTEVLGTRQIRGGLITPEEVTFAIEPKTGELQPSPASFQILDLDDTLSYLFASDGKEYVQLGEHIAPGLTALGTSVVLYDGIATTNPRGRYIGPERIGPSGQRRACPAIPYTLIGPDHAVSPNLPPVLISDEPIQFAGRMVTLYRIYKVRPDLDDSDPTAWALWPDSDAAQDLVWWGVMRDAGNVGGNAIWSIDCHGPDALTRRTLGTRNTSRWIPITAEPGASADEKYVAIGFMSHASGMSATPGDTYFDSSVFAHSFTETYRAAVAAELNGWIESAMDGTSTNVNFGGGDFDTWSDTTNPNPDAGVSNQGVFFVRRDDDTSDNLQWGGMFICMHRDYWRILGFEPSEQHVDGTVFSDLATADFKELAAGEQLKFHGWITGTNVPSDGYWCARFTTVRAGDDQSGLETEPFDNDGAPREWYPKHTSDVFILRTTGDQVVRLSGEDETSLYLEGQPEAGIESASDDIDGTPVEHARWFVIRGDKVVVDDDPSTEEVERSDVQKVHLVCKGQWVEGTHYGDVSVGTGVSPAIRIAYYEFPRAWGWDNNRTISLAGKASGKGVLEIAPLHAYHYKRHTKPYEVAPSVWLQVMLSSGTAPGYDAPHDSGGTFTGGLNAPITPGLDFVDSELADMGLAIPYQLVATPGDVYDVFDSIPGGATGPLNRVRMGYIGPYQAADVLSSLMRPRRLCWSLHGKKFGAFVLGPVSAADADITITEDDLYGPPGEPTSVIPSQTMRATGQLDRVDLKYRLDAETGKPALEARYPALDAEARARTGELVEEVMDHGLCPPWFGNEQEEITGVGDWSELFRQHWARDAAEFFARRHYALELTLSRPLGQDAMPGSSVAITNQWPVNPRGGRGITNATGRILRATHNLREGSTRIECIVFVGASVVHYGPAVMLSRVDGTTVEWYENQGATLDGRGLVEPSWSETGGTLEVDLYQRNGNTWTVSFSAGVVSADLDTRTAVLDAAPGSAILRDKDTWMVPRSYTNQTANQWPRALYGVTTDTDQTIGDATTKAPAFVS